MRKVQKPTDNVRAVFRTCISIVKNLELKTRLEEIERHIVVAANKYELSALKATLHLLPRRNDVAGIVTNKEMTAVYSSRMVRKNTPGRAIYDKLLSLPAYGICPLCGQRIVATLDHHLPKDYYPALAVVPVNLIAACMDCNKNKNTIYPTSEEEQTLHPYYDDIEGDEWLIAEISQSSPVSVRFFVSPLRSMDKVMAARVRFHFKCFKLAELYASHSACEIISIQRRLGRLFDQAGAAAVRMHLQEEADSRAAVHINSWQTAMFKAMAASKWFCEGGFRL